jgi:hypothetical protein
MTDEIRIEDLTAGHVRRYDRINAVTVTEDDGVCAWEKPSKLAVIVAPDFSSSISTFETLNVRIDSCVRSMCRNCTIKQSDFLNRVA